MLKKMNKNTKSNLITYGIVIVAFVVMQLLISTGSISSLLEGLMVPLCMYIILAVSLNLVVGILGELSLGHAGFMCVGAFSSAFFSKCMADVITIAPLRFFLALLVGIASAAVFGIIIGIPVLRLKGDYLAIVTLAFGEIIKNLVNVLFIGKDSNGFHFSTKDVMGLNMEPDGTVIVNGPQGITGTPKDSTFLIGVILILITLFIVINLTNSRDGRAIMAIRDNRIAAESVGINVTKYKLMAFTISAALAGAAGVLGVGAYVFGSQLLGIYTSETEVIQCGVEILSITTVPYFLCGIMDLIPGALRGMGHSAVPMVLSVIGTVGTRIIWIYGFFPHHRSLHFLFISYPGSWIITIIMQAICFYFVRKQCVRQLKSAGNYSNAI